MSNEFCLAAKYFNLSWEEIKQLARNSLIYSFAPRAIRRELVEKWDKEIVIFEQSWQSKNKKIECIYPTLK